MDPSVSSPPPQHGDDGSGIGTARDQSSQASPGIGTARAQSSQEHQPTPPHAPPNAHDDEPSVRSVARSVARSVTTHGGGSVARPQHALHHLEGLILDQFNANRPENTKKVYTPKLIEWRKYCDYTMSHLPSPERYLVHKGSSYRFMVYQAMRSKCSRGGSKPRKNLPVMNENGKRLRPEDEAFTEQEDGPSQQDLEEHLEVEYDPDLLGLDDDDDDDDVDVPLLLIDEASPVLGGSARGFNGTEFDEIMAHYSSFMTGDELTDPINPNGYQLFAQYKAALMNLWDS
jgi:hypothetical protein